MLSTGDDQLKSLRRKLKSLQEAVAVLEVKLGALCDCLEVEEEVSAALRAKEEGDRRRSEKLQAYGDVVDALKEMFGAKEWRFAENGEVQRVE
jgi:hypothetical protein